MQPVMAAHPQLRQARRIVEWFSAHFRRTDGRFSQRFTPRYNADCVVLNVETLWEHYRYHLAKHNLVLCLPALNTHRIARAHIAEHPPTSPAT